MGLTFHNIKKWFKMIFGKSILHVNQGEGKCYSFENVLGYYNDLTEKVLKDKKNYNSTDVIKSEDGTNKDLYYFPISIFQYGLASYDLFLMSGNVLMEEKFINHLKWAYENQNSNGSWNNFERINANSPFSSMAQGEGASLLIRGYIHAKDESYLVAAKKAIDFMLLPCSEGGTAIYNDEDLELLEFTFIPCVYNGWIFSIFGLIDYCILTRDEKYQTLLNKTLCTLKKHLPKMDCGYWSMYDSDKKIASPFYHKLHMAQLKVLYKFTNDPVFDIYCQKFTKYFRNPFYKTRAFFKKTFQKLFSR